MADASYRISTRITVTSIYIYIIICASRRNNNYNSIEISTLRIPKQTYFENQLCSYSPVALVSAAYYRPTSRPTDRLFRRLNPAIHAKQQNYFHHGNRPPATVVFIQFYRFVSERKYRAIDVVFLKCPISTDFPYYTRASYTP